MTQPTLPSAEIDPGPPGPGRTAAIALVLLVLVCRLLAVHSCPVYDDAFITYRYARNLAQGEGLVFDPGEPWEPVLGTTTPGYAVLIGGLVALGLDPVRASLGVNLAADVAIALALLALLRRRGTVAATVSLVAFAALPHLARISVGGMEAPLFAALALGAALANQRERWVTAGVCAALACTVRPEGVLLVGVLAALHLRRPRALLRLAVPVAIVGLVTVGALVLAYGSPVPHSVTAKSATHAARTLALTVERWGLIFRQSLAPSVLMLPAVPFVLLGLVRSLRERRGEHVFVLFALAIVASYLAARPHTWGWYYYVPLVAWTIGLGLGGAALLAALAPRLPDGLLRFLRRGGVPLTCAAVAVAVLVTTRARPDAVTAHVYGPLAEFLEGEELAGTGKRILASDIGAVGYWAPVTVLDSEGLVWPDALAFLSGTDVHSAQMEMVRRYEPEYLVLVAERGRVGRLVADPELRARYEAVARFNAWGDDDLGPDPATLPDHWRQDYLVYRRR